MVCLWLSCALRLLTTNSKKTIVYIKAGSVVICECVLFLFKESVFVVVLGSLVLTLVFVTGGFGFVLTASSVSGNG